MLIKYCLVNELHFLKVQKYFYSCTVEPQMLVILRFKRHTYTKIANEVSQPLLKS